MATRTDDNATDRGQRGGHPDRTRYADLRLGDGTVIIYDRTDEDAWIQSASAIGLEFMV